MIGTGLIAKAAAGVVGWGVPEWLSRPLVIGALVIGALAFGSIAGPWAWSHIKGSIIENAANEANSDFLEKKNEVAGEAQADSDERREALAAEVKETEDLIDEAQQKGCAVADYLGSNGSICVRIEGSAVPDPST